MVRAVDWIPVTAAAKLLGCSRQRVHQLVRSGKLASERYEGVTLVSTASISGRIRASQLLIPLRAPDRGGG